MKTSRIRLLMRPFAFGVLVILSLNTGLRGDIVITGDFDPVNSDFWTNGGDSSTDGVLGSTSNAELTVSSGSLLNLLNGYFGDTDGVSGTATVTGSGSQIDFSANLELGNLGTGYLTITDYGLVTADYVDIGAENGSMGTATVQENGELSLSSDLYVGLAGNGSLLIQSGGNVDASNVYTGEKASATGSLTVTGLGSLLDVTACFEIGSEGSGYLTISDSGQAMAECGSIGTYASSDGYATIQSGGSFILSEDTFIGFEGSGTMLVESGGSVSAKNAYVATIDDSYGLLTVTGVGSSFSTTNDFNVGDYGNGTLVIEDGGYVETGGSVGIGVGPAAIGKATVTGAGSQWKVTSGLSVGDGGNGTLIIENGGYVETGGDANIGASSTGIGNATVSGAGSQWVASSDLNAGVDGYGSLTVSDSGDVQIGGYFGVGVNYRGDAVISSGGTVSSSIVVIGAADGITGNLRVTGVGSTITTSSDFIVGDYGSGNLTVEDGGVVNTGAESYIGNAAGGSGVVTVRGSGSWNGDQSLAIGNGGVGVLNVSDAGQVNMGRDINVGSDSTLNISVTNDGMVNAGLAGEEDWGDFVNSGVVNLIANSLLPAGNYEPITVGVDRFFTNNGEINAIGGAWNSSTNQFEVSAITTDGTGDLSGKRVSYFNDLVVSFADDVGVQTFEVAQLSVEFINGQEVLDAYSFDTTITSLTFLSMDIGEGYDANSISIWYLGDGESVWTLYDSELTEYQGNYFSFAVDSFSSYAVTVVPEPSTHALLFAAIVVLGTVVRRRR